MVKKHMKSLAAPKTWPIRRKNTTFVIRPSPGPHKFEFSVPLGFVLKNMLVHANSSREAKKMLINKSFLVNEVRRRDLKFQIGIFDTLSIEETKSFFRLILNKMGKLSLVRINDDESKSKPCKIIGKTSIKGGKFQLNLYDGRNILINKDGYKVGDTLIISLPDNSIKAHLKLEKKSKIFLTGGKHIGEFGVIEDISSNKIIYKNKNGESVETLKRHAFVVDNSVYDLNERS